MVDLNDIGYRSIRGGGIEVWSDRRGYVLVGS